MKLFFELYEDTPRQGPGSAATTRRALGLLPDTLQIDRVLDLGCGTGASTVVLAEETGARITAVDIHPPFLETLRAEAEKRGIGDRVTTVAGNMADAASQGADFDLIWAEGSAYSIGFENALRTWRPLLRPGGCLVVTELAWFVAEPAEEARAFFANEYPDMKDEATRLDQARSLGYEVVNSFRLPPEDWQAYYAGLIAAVEQATVQHGELDIYAASRREAEIYETHGGAYGYMGLVLRAPA